MEMKELLTLMVSFLLDNQLSVTDLLLLAFDLANLHFLGGQTTLMVSTVHNTQAKEGVTAKLKTESRIEYVNWIIVMSCYRYLQI